MKLDTAGTLPDFEAPVTPPILATNQAAKVVMKSETKLSVEIEAV